MGATAQDAAQSTMIASMQDQNAAQGTMIAITGDQLGIQRAMATSVAGGVEPGPTATEVGRRVATLHALEEERHKVEATLTAIAMRATISATPAPAVALQEVRPEAEATLIPISERATSSGPPGPRRLNVQSQVPRVSAELVEFSRFESTITVKVRLINSGTEEQHLKVTSLTYLLDEATHEKYSVYEQSNPTTAEAPAGSSVEVWAKYGLPEEAEPQYLTVVLRDGILLEHIEVASFGH